MRGLLMNNKQQLQKRIQQTELQIKKLGQKIFGEQIENFTLNTNYGNGQITPPPANNPDTGEKK